MRAFVLTSLDGPAALRSDDVDEPSGDGVVVQVAAVGVNFPDLLAMRGAYQNVTPPPFVPGSEVSGLVVSAPHGSRFATGDRVMAAVSHGGLAERVVVPERLLRHVPSELDLAQAVSLVVNAQSAVFAMRWRGAVEAGQTVVVLGAAGGIGTACLQVGRASGARTIAVVRRAGTEDFLTTAGADHVVPLADGWRERIAEITDGRGADVVIDPIGGPAFDDAVRCLAPGGRLVVVGFAAGAGIPSVEVDRLLLRNVSVVGSGWGERVRSDPLALHAIGDEVDALVRAGMRPPVTARYEFAEAAAAYVDLAEGRVVGKAVIDGPTT